MTNVQPSFKKPLWLIRAGLYLLFPPFLMAESILGAILCSFFGGGLDTMLNILFGYLTTLGVVFGVVLPFTSGIYGGTTFKITPTGITHGLDFLWNKRKEVLLLNIKEVELKVGFLQKFFGLGTIVIHTQASAAGDTKTGLSLFDVENPSKFYELLRENVSKANILPSCR